MAHSLKKGILFSALLLMIIATANVAEAATYLTGPSSVHIGELATYTLTSTFNKDKCTYYINDQLMGNITDYGYVNITYSTNGHYQVRMSCYSDSAHTILLGGASATTDCYPYNPTVTLSGPTTAKEGDTKQFSIIHNGTSSSAIEWKLDGTTVSGATGTTANIQIPSSGSHVVSVRVYYPNTPYQNYAGIETTKTQTVLVAEMLPPLVSINTPTTGIVGVPFDLFATVTGQNGEGEVLESYWTMPDGTVVNSTNATYTPQNEDSGTKTYLFTAYPQGLPNRKHEVSANISVSLIANLVTLSGPSAAKEGDTKQFTVNFDGPSSSAIEWKLDGTTISGATGTSADIQLTLSGSHEVSARVYYPAYAGAETTKTQTVLVAEMLPPLVSINTPTTGIVGVPFDLFATVTGQNGEGEVLELYWTMPDGTVVNATNATYTPKNNDYGTKTYLFTAHPVGAQHRKREISAEISVTATTPIVTLTGPTVATEGLTVRYSIAIEDAAIGTTTAWTVNGESYNAGSDLDIAFPASGTYNIAATVSAVGIPQLAATKTLTVLVLARKAPLVALNVPGKGITGAPIELKASVKSLNEGETLVSYWTMPDGTVVNSLDATYTPRKEDVGTAVFKFTSYPEDYIVKKKEAIANVVITDYIMPTFTLKRFSKDGGMVPYKVSYASMANIRGVTEKFNYTWDMGDGAIYSDMNKVSHTYLTANAHPVTLTVSDQRGNTAVLTDTINVIPMPELSVTPLTAKGSNKYMRAPVTVMIRAKVLGGNQKVDRVGTYSWTINGEPAGKNSNMLIYEFTEPGTYEVVLTATTKAGFTTNTSATVTVVPNQLPDCTIAALDVPLYKKTKFEAKCTDPDGRIKSYLWDFGNGQTMNVKKPVVGFTESGTYTATLTATDNSGGSTTVTQDVAVSR